MTMPATSRTQQSDLRTKEHRHRWLDLNTERRCGAGARVARNGGVTCVMHHDPRSVRHENSESSRFEALRTRVELTLRSVRRIG